MISYVNNVIRYTEKSVLAENQFHMQHSLAWNSIPAWNVQMHESFTPYSLLELSDLIEHGRGANGTICEVSIKVVNGSNDPSDPTHPTRLIQPDRKIGIMKHKGLCHLKCSKCVRNKQSDWSDFISWTMQAIWLVQLHSLWRGFEKYFRLRVTKVPFLPEILIVIDIFYWGGGISG